MQTESEKNLPMHRSLGQIQDALANYATPPLFLKINSLNRDKIHKPCYLGFSQLVELFIRKVPVKDLYGRVSKWGNINLIVLLLHLESP
jgi:hypothetical protein